MVADHEFRVHAKLPLRSRILKKWVVRVARVERAKATHDSVGNQLNVAPRRNSLKPVQRRCLAQPAFYFAGDLRPERVFVLAIDAAIQNDSPLLLLGGREAQALEWNSHLD